MAGWRDEFKQDLAERFLLRIHMTLIVVGMLASGFLTSHLLLVGGIYSLGARYFLAALVAYGAFFGLVRLWLLHVARIGLPALSDGAVTMAAAASMEPVLPLATRLGWGDGDGDDGQRDSTYDPFRKKKKHKKKGGGGGGSAAGGAGGLIVVLIVVAIVVILFGATIYIVWEAPVILAEVAIEAAVVGALAKRAVEIDRPGWSGSVLRATWKPMLAVLAAVTIGGWMLQMSCKGAPTLPRAVELCAAEYL